MLVFLIWRNFKYGVYKQLSVGVRTPKLQARVNSTVRLPIVQIWLIYLKISSKYGYLFADLRKLKVSMKDIAIYFQFFV